MRSDAKENYLHLLATARAVVSEEGANASMRDIARKAGMGPATLFRHFPTRDALLDTLLRSSLEALTQKADAFESASSADEALVAWLREAVGFVRIYSGVVTLMANALSDPGSALHTSCENLRNAGTRLLTRAQVEGMADRNMTGSDMFALIGALGWIGDQASYSERSEYLFDVIASAILTHRPSRDAQVNERAGR
ncbi:TetR/AcrR family transcriptional regulator [Stenotrophomonas sp. ISL-67]|uniref:TetR/AcrR family transcriptional regulator n=1 Tax=Stenotrophomonas sp. ISL-67 TaxID=2819171 RepID=UPI001BECE0CB|nr:TetR/AcrR family transcriptional regulator [Stenotrophomonas sp. ISL-67]MBT2767640.1 TetR/AcrR family transcriptional regulator [Stenotrophomonas sp. ISL-67]